MSDHTPSLATAREVFIDGAQGEFLGEDFDRMIEAVRAETLREAQLLLALDGFFCPALDERIEKEAGL